MIGFQRPAPIAAPPDEAPALAAGSPADTARAGLVAWATGLAAFVLYWATLAPSIAWSHQGADSGDLVTAAVTLGVPHPSGYPLFTLLAHLAAGLTPDEPARGVNLLSAGFGAIAVGLIGWLAATVAPTGRHTPAALVAAIGFALTPLFWSQAILTEVYTLATVLLVGFWIALIGWRRRWPGPGAGRWLALAGGVFGLGLAHHLTIALAAPFAAILVLATARRRAFRPGVWLAPAIAVLPGLALYAYLPIRAAANPPLNWGRPFTWEGFWWVVTAENYRRHTGHWELLRPEAGATFVGHLIDQFPLVLLPLAAWGAYRLTRRDGPVALLLLGTAAALTVYRLTYRVTGVDAYLIPLDLVVAVGLGLGFAGLPAWPPRLPGRVRRLVDLGAVALVLVLMGGHAAATYARVDLSREFEPRRYGVDTLAAMPPRAILLTDRDEQTFSLWYAQHVLGVRSDVALVSPALLSAEWYQNHLRAIYPDLAVGDLGRPIGSRVLELIGQNVDRRPVVVGMPDRLIDLYFETRDRPDGLVEVIGPRRVTGR